MRIKREVCLNLYGLSIFNQYFLQSLCVCVCVCACLSACLFADICTHACLLMVCVCVCVFVCVCVCVCVRAQLSPLSVLCSFSLFASKHTPAHRHFTVP